MKTIKILILLVTLVGFMQQTNAQNAGVPGDIVVALNNGDVNKLSGYLNNNVEVAIGNQNNVVSKQQAIGIITDFFRKNTVTGFQVLHSGNKENASFIIGTLKTNNGNYRVYVLTRKVDGKPVIQQLRIESNNE